MKVASVDNLLFLLLIAGAALFQLLSKAVTKAGKKQSDETSIPPRPPHAPRAPAESDADRIRKFLEALGQPPGSTPPPPVVPRIDIPPRSLAPIQPPSVTQRAWRLPREQRQKPEITPKESPSPEEPSRVEKVILRQVSTASSSVFEVHKGAGPLQARQQPVVETSVETRAAVTQQIVNWPDLKTEIVTLLKSKSGLREAIMLREIFGPPRGLHDPDATR